LLSAFLVNRWQNVSPGVVVALLAGPADVGEVADVGGSGEVVSAEVVSAEVVSAEVVGAEVVSSVAVLSVSVPSSRRSRMLPRRPRSGAARSRRWR